MGGRAGASIALLIGAVIVALVAIAGSSPRTEAHAGQYAHFPGPDTGWIEVPDDPALTPSAITIEAWVFLDTYVPWGTQTSCPVIVGKAYKTSYWLGVCGKIRYYPRGGTNNYWEGTGTIPLGEWTHIAVTYDGTDTKTYINGALDSMTASISGPIGSNTTALGIGSDADWVATPKGAVDEVRIWNVARTQAEIAGAMNTTITTAQAGLVGAWNMEGDGTDSLGAHNGSLHGNIEFSADPLESETPTPTESPSATPTPTESPSPTPSAAPTESGSPTASPTPVPGAFRKGDVNCDGHITGADALPYLAFSQFLVSYPPACTGSAPAAGPQGGFGQWWNGGNGSGGYVEIPYDAALNPTSAITIELLINAWSFQSPSGTGCLSLVGNGYLTAYWLGLCNGRLRFYSRGTGSARDSLQAIPLREWTHVAVVADASDTKFYINGVLDHDFTGFSGPLTTNTNPVRIGSDHDYNYHPWAALDEVRIWNVARTGAEILATKDIAIIAPLPGLVAAYQFEGNTNDTTGAHNGTAVGTVDIGNDLPPPNWADLDCDGFLRVKDALVALYGAVGLTYPGLPAFCEPVGTSIPQS